MWRDITLLQRRNWLNNVKQRLKEELEAGGVNMSVELRFFKDKIR